MSIFITRPRKKGRETSHLVSACPTRQLQRRSTARLPLKLEATLGGSSLGSVNQRPAKAGEEDDAVRRSLAPVASGGQMHRKAALGFGFVPDPRTVSGNMIIVRAMSANTGHHVAIQDQGRQQERPAGTQCTRILAEAGRRKCQPGNKAHECRNKQHQSVGPRFLAAITTQTHGMNPYTLNCNG